MLPWRHTLSVNLELVSRFGNLSYSVTLDSQSSKNPFEHPLSRCAFRFAASRDKSARNTNDDRRTIEST